MWIIEQQVHTMCVIDLHGFGTNLGGMFISINGKKSVDSDWNTSQPVVFRNFWNNSQMHFFEGFLIEVMEKLPSELLNEFQKELLKKLTMNCRSSIRRNGARSVKY